MPFDLTLIANANPAELHVVEFSNEDFSDKNPLEKLKEALLPFQKLKFKLTADISDKNRATFIDFTIKYLDSNKVLQEFDLSDNQFAVEGLSPKKTTQSTRGKEASKRGKGPRRIY